VNLLVVGAPIDAARGPGSRVRPYDRRVTEGELVRVLTDLPGVASLTAGQENGAPQVAWGDSFFFYDPDDSIPADRRMPFATIVIKDYPGFDVASDLDRPGVFRLNLAVGRDRFEELFGFAPAAFPEHSDAFDFSVLDRVIPHPVYATQGWICILMPGEQAADQVTALITHAHRRAKDRYERSRRAGRPAADTG
jgi:hypothetical protein